MIFLPGLVEKAGSGRLTSFMFLGNGRNVKNMNLSVCSAISMVEKRQVDIK